MIGSSRIEKPHKMGLDSENGCTIPRRKRPGLAKRDYALANGRAAIQGVNALG